MASFAVLLPLVTVALLIVWFGVRFTRMVKKDGYGFRAASGLPRDWSPSVDLPSTSYAERPHH